MAHLVFALTAESHDMYRDSSSIALLRDSDAVMQTIKTRLLTHYNEWFLDLSAGLPWFTELLTHNPNIKLIEARIAETISNTDGVKTLLSLDVIFDRGNRALKVGFKYTDVYGNTLTESQMVLR